MTSKLQHRRYRNLIARIRLKAAMAALAPGRATGWWKRFGILCLLVCVVLAATVITSSAQEEQHSNNAVTFNSLVNFDGTNGNTPVGNLVQGTDGNLYGATDLGGGYGSRRHFQDYPYGNFDCALQLLRATELR